jgi:hypothetical protein
MNLNDIYCPICFGDINFDFCTLNCDCKTSVYHKNCIDSWFKIKKQCPVCKKQFNKNKPLKKVVQPHFPIKPFSNVFGINYNILRIMSGMSGLQYSS